MSSRPFRLERDLALLCKMVWHVPREVFAVNRSAERSISGVQSSRLAGLRGDRLEEIQERIEAVRDAFVQRLSREEDGHEKVVT